MFARHGHLTQSLARLRSRHIGHAYLFIAPVVLLFGIFRVVPSVQTLLYSFYKVELLRGRFTFIGLENFRSIFADETFRQATPRLASRRGPSWRNAFGRSTASPRITASPTC